jgi:CubicO group peptidase (beta-lactamase class C family)
LPLLWALKYQECLQNWGNARQNFHRENPHIEMKSFMSALLRQSALNRHIMKFQLLLTAFAATVSTTSMANEFVNKPSSLDIPIATLNQAGFSSDGLKRIDAFFASEIEKKRVPGGVVGIVRDGKLVYLKAHGTSNPETQAPMQVDSIFALASMTKPMVAVGTLTLTQQAKLPLFSKVSDYYPAVGAMKVAIKKPDGSMDFENVKSPMTVQDLMRHTSGLTYGGRPDTSGAAAALYPSGGQAMKMNGSAEFMDKISKLPLVYQPGTIFEYSLSFEVLGAVIEKVSGKSLDAYLRESIWNPLRMSDTGFHVAENKISRQAHPFKLNPLNNSPQTIEPLGKGVNLECGGGCSLGTVPDYLKFGQMLINGGEFNGKRILSPAMVKLMTSDQMNKKIINNVANVEPHREGYGFGLGVAVRTEPGLAAVPGNVGEYSWNGAYGTGFFADPQAKLVVVFGTAAPGDLRKYYREQIQNLVYGAMTR